MTRGNTTVAPRRGKSSPAGLSWPEIRANAARFAKDWKGVTSERAESQTFWNELFGIFGVERRRVAVYEQRAERFNKRGGRIDVFWPGTLLAEHKSTGQSLDAAFEQATDYFAGLTEVELPRYVVVSDFQQFRVYDLDEKSSSDFPLSQLAQRIQDLAFIAGYSRVRLVEEPDANIKAVGKLGELHDALKANRYGVDADGRAGHGLRVLLVRLLFCLFADDTGLFSPKDAFRDLIESTREDGSDTGAELAKLFQVLDLPRNERQASLVDRYAAFPHVNGKLFQETLPIPDFDARMRTLLLECCDVQWAGISPAIFGAMFQKVIELDAKALRRELGAHYTSEANILKLIGPLFLDDLKTEFESVRHDPEVLAGFHRKLTELHFLDPACGCGNFLVITYRELRKLETAVLEAASAFGHPDLDRLQELQRVRLEQFHGIEIEEFPAQVAQVAAWIAQHQMDLVAGKTFGTYFRHLPLTDSAHIRRGDALQLDWAEVVPPAQLRFILGNPPFVGKQLQTPEQKRSLSAVTRGISGAGVLDFVAGWYLKAAQYVTGDRAGALAADRKQFKDVEFSNGQRRRPGHSDLFVAANDAEVGARARVRCGFVSTSSITQGEQVGLLWGELLRRGVTIDFAHRTFQWTNEAPGKAAVHCVIIGFGAEGNRIRSKRLFTYGDPKGLPTENVVAEINPYLADAPTTLITKRGKPLQLATPEMRFGSMANDGGHLLLDDNERKELLNAEPAAAAWLRPFMQVDELLYGTTRWCLWLVDISPAELAKLPLVRARVAEVRKHRLKSDRAATKKLADVPTLFGEVRQPGSEYFVVPRHTGEDRAFIPIAKADVNTICGDANLLIADASLFTFGIMQSTMHMAWVRAVCGRLESRFRYSAGIVYNNFPWPAAELVPLREAVEIAAQGVLDARAKHADSNLATLYGSDMPANLVKAHRALDKAVDAVYRADGAPRSFTGDADRVAFLFRRYAALTSLV